MSNISAKSLTLLDIDLGAVAANIKILKSKISAKTALAGVVKANAYGLGLEQIALTHLHAGTRSFFVATLEEGTALRQILDQSEAKDTEIAILCGLLPGMAGEYLVHRLTPVLNDLGQVALCRKDLGGLPAMLHVDTGMRRLGLDAGEAAAVLADPALLDGIQLAAILSHLACADEPDHPLNAQQLQLFDRFTAQFSGVRQSFSNSSGLFLSPAYHRDLARPGMAVYGLNPVAPLANPMKPVVRLRARILQLRDAAAGESVGYSATYQCTKPRRVATIALGYADGFLRSLSSRGFVFFGEPGQQQPCPIIGRVSMDLITVDVTDLTGAAPRAGDFVDVFGAGQDVDHLAGVAGTIGYEILTALGARHTRHYHGHAV
jgi:alanine racemase